MPRRRPHYSASIILAASARSAFSIVSSTGNRTGDNWRGLFSIAEPAGGEWPERAKQAAMEEISEEDSNHADAMEFLRAALVGAPVPAAELSRVLSRHPDQPSVDDPLRDQPQEIVDLALKLIAAIRR